MYGLPLASDPMGFFGALIVIVVLLMFFGVFIAATFGPIALVIAAIVKSFRNSAPTGSPGFMFPGTSITTSSGERVIAVDPASTFGQAFGATLQQALGQQLGEKLRQMVALAAAQHPLELQLAPIVVAVEAARQQGNPGPVRPFLTDQFAARFPSLHGGGQRGGLAAISHMALMNQGTVPGDHVVIRIDRGGTGAVHSEYWSFRRDASAVPDGTPVVCPRCGAPTAEDHSGTCRFCGATFSTAAPALPQPTRWLLDDISGTPPALAA
ncbi:MAG TPA: hypothetical protein VJT14_03870 [Candidatus Dormibacteraeota bacterium]|nr:hypothetical protein [Candidatus Dormibacteraeota bacterium]